MNEYLSQVTALDALSEGLKQDWKKDADSQRGRQRLQRPQGSFTTDLRWFLRRSMRRITRSGR